MPVVTVPFETVPLGTFTATQRSSSRLKPTMEVIFHKTVPNGLLFLLYFIHDVGVVPVQLRPHFGGTRKTHTWVKSGEYVGCGAIAKTFSLTNCVVLVQQPRVVEPQFRSSLSHIFSQALQNVALEVREKYILRERVPLISIKTISVLLCFLTCLLLWSR